MALDDLYQEIILEHYKKPQNQGVIDNADFKIEGKNPFCGDEIKLSIKLKDDMIDQVAFQGAGCAISQASASLMTSKIKGKNVQDVKDLIADFAGMVKGDGCTHCVLEEMDELMALKGVSEFPTRVKCALLAWNALKEGLERELEKRK